MKQLVTLITLASSLSVLAGCGTGLTGTATTGGGQGTAGISLSGTVHGGSQAITGASIQLWTVGTTGYGSTGSVVTSTSSGAGGSFALPSYTCSPAGELVYLTATGGNPGLPSGTNSQISLLTALGPCSGLSSNQKVEIDEATTVASVYALAQFMSSSGSIGSYSANTVGITNAFATVNNLVSTSTGAVLTYTPAGNGLVPNPELNTLANILAYCVNSAGGTAGSNTNCGKLFTDTTVNSVAPANTLQAALNIALNPVNSSIFSLVSTSGPFQPTLSASPNDWSVAVMYGGTYPGTTGVAIDARGNVWTTAAGGSGNGAVVELTPLGAVAANSPLLAGVDGFTGIAVDLGNNAWTSNNNTALIREFFQGGGYTGAFQLQETAGPKGLAVDLNNHIWVVNSSSNTVSEFSNQGAGSKGISPSGGYIGGSLSSPVGVAPDASGNVWVTDSNGASLTKITTGGSVSGYSGSSLNGAAGIAVDTSGDLWVTDAGNSSVVEFNSAGTQTTVASPGGSLSSGGTLDAVDGANHIWVANASSGTLSEFNSSGTVLSPTTGLQAAPVATSYYTGTALKQPYAVAVDLSGNVWVSNQNPPQIASNLNAGVTEFIGLGAPTIQPLALAALQGQVGKLPGTPTGVSLVVTSSALPSSVTGAKYNFQLLAKGGTGNGYAWQVTSGASTLTNAGLTLSSGGTLSGTLSGTVSGASIGFKVTDSSGSNATTTLSLTITTPATLSITTTNIASATVGTNYSQTFAATGGSGSYTWSVPNQTQLNALNAAGLGYGPSGNISGSPTASGNIPFTMQVTDLATGATASAPYTLVINNATLSQCTHDGSGNSILNGSYAFLLGGFDPNGHAFEQIGSFTANGAGTITSGVTDINGDNTLSQFSNGELQVSFSGTYSIGSTDDRGILTINGNSSSSSSGLPSTTIYCFAADTVTSGIAYSGRLIEADGSGYVRTGTFQIQNTANFNAAALSGGYAFGVSGEDTPPNRRASVGQFTLNGSGGVSSGQLDFASANNSGSSESYTAAASILNTSTYTMGANGRGTLTLNISGNTLNFITYEFGNNYLFLMSANDSVNPLLLGNATPQTLTTFTTANIKGSGVFRSDGAPSATADDMQVGVLTYNGSGTITFIADENSAGTITTPSAVQSANYAVSSLGYVTISGAGSNTVNFYLYAPGGGYGTSSSNEVDFWTMVPQTVPSGGFTSASLSGAYSAGTVPTASYSTSGAGTSGAQAYPQVADLWLSFGSGTLSYTQDQDQPPGTIPYVSTGQTGSTTWALDGTYGAAYGRFTTNGGPIGYIVSPTQAILLQESSGKDGQLFNVVHH